MLKHKAMELLKQREFVSVGTCDFKGKPNAAPKFVLKLDDHFVYLVDYTIGQTWKNLKLNPQASISFMDPDTLVGYKIDGSVEVVEKGSSYRKMFDEMQRKQVSLTAQHIIEEVRGAKAHNSFEVEITEHFVIYKISIEEITEIGPRGELKRNKVNSAIKLG